MQQQPQASRRSVPAPAAQAPSNRPHTAGIQPAPVPRTPFESTVATVSDIGIKVSEMRSVYDVYRTAAFNQTDGALAERASQFGASCRTLVAAIQQQSHVLCRSCVAVRIQSILDAYRASLPGVQRTAQQCATRMQSVNPRAPTPAQVTALRGDVRTIGAQLMTGLREYEMRLHNLRVAMGWDTPPMPTPRRGTRS